MLTARTAKAFGPAHRCGLFFCRSRSENSKPSKRRLSMKSRFMIVLATISIVLAGTGLLNATTPGTSNNLQLVGENSLFGRGMNAAAANYKNFLYVGNRTDGSSRCGFGDPRRTDPNFGLDSCPHVHPGILILDINDPTSPTVVGEIPAPLNPAGQPVGITSRELRVWPSEKLLVT